QSRQLCWLTHTKVMSGFFSNFQFGIGLAIT
ncbi:MAG: hypothetical protein ACI9UT_003146, partial [Flavobacteriales bacterium]